MSESVAQVYERLRPPRRRIVRPAVPAIAGNVVIPPSFAVENHESNRVVIATPIETAALKYGDFVMDFRGRLVEAEHANRNGAFWSQADLEFGLPSVALGPLNWGHDPKDIVGALADANLVTGEQAAVMGVNAHISTGARFWSYLNPAKSRMLKDYIEQKRAWFSMECISKEIACVGPNVCGRVMSYADAQGRTGGACEHVKERASHRRFVDPIFQGAAVIVPPQEPGWLDAAITGVVTEAESQAEAAQLQIDGLSDADALLMVTSILQWSKNNA